MGHLKIIVLNLFLKNIKIIILYIMILANISPKVIFALEK
jgi:hypothetical protein